MTTVPSFTSISKFFLGMFLGLLCIEVILSIMPVATAFDRDTKSFPIRHWLPNSTYVYSNGWNFRNPQEGRLNNYGFVNVPDYSKGGSDVLVIGDSYIEAQQVLQDMTAHAIVKQKTGLETYAIGINDSQFADYMKYMEYGVQEFNPKYIVIKSFDADFYKAFSNPRPQGSYFSDSETNLQLLTHPEDLQQGKLRNFLKQSNLMRYLFINLRVPKKLISEIQLLRGKETKQSLSLDAEQVDAMMHFLAEQLDKLSIDKNRVILISDSAEGFEHISSHGFAVINSSELLSKFELETGFSGNNLPYDGHWNFRGHYLVGSAIAEKVLDKQ